jgi:hypothetical protein
MEERLEVKPSATAQHRDASALANLLYTLLRKTDKSSHVKLSVDVDYIDQVMRHTRSVVG